MKYERTVTLLIGIVMGTVLALPLYAQFISWSKQDVVPVLLVKPGIGGFVPVQGSTIGNTWSKENVVPMCAVKTGIGGFIPKEGTSIGNTWSKEEVKPIILVQSQMGQFVPAE